MAAYYHLVGKVQSNWMWIINVFMVSHSSCEWDEQLYDDELTCANQAVPGQHGKH